MCIVGLCLYRLPRYCIFARGGIFELLIDIECNIVDYLTFLYIICSVYQLIMI